MKKNPFAINENPLLKLDFYKTVHSEQYPENLEYITSYYTPRMSRIPGQNEVVMFGLQAFLIKELRDYFNDYFFGIDVEVVVADYERTIKHTFAPEVVNVNKVRELHALGYLPLKISAVKEGTLIPVRVPMIEVTNTHPKFAWLVNTIETIMSVSLWNGMIAANLGYNTRQIVNEWYGKTVSDSVPTNGAISEFSMRGQDSYETSRHASAAWLLSHVGTATVPAIKYMEYYYYSDIENELVGRGLPSTEHSVMCSNATIDGDEITMYKRLLTDLYPNTSFSVVADSYDYWNVIDELLPSIKTEVEAHNGAIYVRGDSGDPIEIVAGKKVYEVVIGTMETLVNETLAQANLDTFEIFGATYVLGKFNEKFVLINVENKTVTEVSLSELPSDVIGTVAALYRNFPGETNEKGYKVLSEKIRVMYGDSITPIRMREIFSRLEIKGFASNNTSLGIGSFSMQAIEGEDGTLYPNTRDTFGVAIKTTHAIVDGKEIEILKDPKTDTGNFKKSQKGLIAVHKVKGKIVLTDQLTVEQKRNFENDMLQTVFVNGTLCNPERLEKIRERLHNGKF